MSKSRLQILLLNHSLRLHDNPLFHLPPSTHLLPLYILSPTLHSLPPHPVPLSRTAHFPRCGPYRATFLAEALWDLKTNLRQRNSDLLIRAGPPASVISAFLSSLDVASVAMVEAVGSEEREEAEAVRRVVEEAGVEFRLVEDGGYLYNLEKLPFKLHDLSDMFTTFRKLLEPLRETIPPPLPPPSSLPPLPPNIPPDSTTETYDALIKTLVDPVRLPDLPLPEGARSAYPFHGGETAAHARLQHLLASGAIAAYKQTRNGLVGEDFSTKLSGYLAQGSISARSINAALSGDAGAGPEAVRFELLWRDYFRLCALRYGRRLFSLSGYRGASGSGGREGGYTWKSPSSAVAEVQRFLDGTTGSALVDASMRELRLTGWTSNRARQNVASYLAKRLKVDWRVGAEWYEYLLVDYDVASNWGNWQYVAGVGNDPRAKGGGERVFNQEKQRRDYDPRGEYVRMWLGEGWEERGKPLVVITDVGGGGKGGGGGNGRGKGGNGGKGGGGKGKGKEKGKGGKVDRMGEGI